MNQCSNQQDGALSFSLKVKTQEDGKVTVSCPAQPQIPPTTAATYSSAVSGHTQKLQKAAGKPQGLKGV
jgi:hypothetical protein